MKPIPYFEGYYINEDMEVFNRHKLKMKIGLNGECRLKRNDRFENVMVKDLYIAAYQRFDLVETLDHEGLQRKRWQFKREGLIL